MIIEVKIPEEAIADALFDALRIKHLELNGTEPSETWLERKAEPYLVALSNRCGDGDLRLRLTWSNPDRFLLCALPEIEEVRT